MSSLVGSPGFFSEGRVWELRHRGDAHVGGLREGAGSNADDASPYHALRSLPWKRGGRLLKDSMTPVTAPDLIDKTCLRGAFQI